MAAFLLFLANIHNGACLFGGGCPFPEFVIWTPKWLPDSDFQLAESEKQFSEAVSRLLSSPEYYLQFVVVEGGSWGISILIIPYWFKRKVRDLNVIASTERSEGRGNLMYKYFMRLPRALSLPSQ